MEPPEEEPQGESSSQQVDELTEVLYEALQHTARGILGRGRDGEPVDPTDLVHEAYVRLAGALVGLAITGSGCGDACIDLSEKICQCEPTEGRQQACLQRVSDEEGSKVVSQSDREVCETKLDSCTCAKLADGELAACGLSRDSN